MTTLAKPLLALPIAVTAPSAQHVTVTFSDSSIGATTMTFSLPAGTYWNHRQSGGDSLGQAFLDAANTAEAAKFGGSAGTWSKLTLSGGLSHRQAFKRAAGHANDTVVGFTLDEPSTGLSGQMLGYASDTVAPTAGSAGATYEFEGTYQRGRIWAPRTYALRQEQLPERTVRSRSSRYNRKTVVTVYSAEDMAKRYLIRTGPVQAVLVWDYLTADSSFVATVSGMAANDPNITLEALWRDHGTLAPIRYLPDEDTPGTYDLIEIADEGWLADLASGLAEVGDGSPLLYAVSLPAQEYVS